MLRTIPFWRRWKMHLHYDIWYVYLGFVFFAIYFRTRDPNRLFIYKSGVMVGLIPLVTDDSKEFPHWSWYVRESSEDPKEPWHELPEWKLVH